MAKLFFVYILASSKYGTLYVGMTSNLSQRIWQHKEKVFEGFIREYGVNKLVYYEFQDCVEGAIIREKRLKRWRRSWKIDLIESLNPNWDDLYESIAWN